MFWGLFVNENTKLFKRSMLWIQVIILVILVAAINGIMFAEIAMEGASIPAEAAAQMRQGLVWPGSLPSALDFTVVFGNLFIIILVGAVTAQEYTWRTLHLWISHGTPRLALSGAKLLSLVMPAFVYTAAGLLTGGLLTAFFSLSLLGRLPIDEVNFLQLFWSSLRVIYGLLPYAALTFLLAIATRSTVAAVGGGLAYNLLVEGLLMQILPFMGGRVAELVKYLPGSMSRALSALNAHIVNGYSAGPVDPNPFLLDPLPAAIGIALWTLFFGGLAMLIFQRQDLPA